MYLICILCIKTKKNLIYIQVISLLQQDFIKMFYLNILLITASSSRERFATYHSNAAENFMVNPEKNNIFKVFEIKHKKKKIYFHTVFPVFTYRSFVSETNIRSFDCIFEVKFNIDIDDNQQELFIGKVFEAKNCMSVFEINKSFYDASPAILKKKNASIFETNFFSANSSKYFKLKETMNFIDKKIYSDNFQRLYFFDRFSKITEGIKDHIFNFKFITMQKNTFFKISPIKSRLQTKFYYSNKNFENVKKLIVFIQRNLCKKTNLFKFAFIKMKNSLRKGLCFSCCSLGFLTRKFFYISSSIILNNVKNSFNVAICVVDLSHQYHIENKFRCEESLPFLLSSRIKSCVIEEIGLNFSRSSHNPYCVLSEKQKKNIKFMNSVILMKINDDIWNKKKSISEFRTNIYFAKFRKKMKKRELSCLFSERLRLCIENIFIALVTNKTEQGAICTDGFIKKTFQYFPGDSSSLWYTIKWNNLDLDFNLSKYKKMIY